MTVLAQNLKTIRKNLNCTQMAISEVLDIGFRTYVRYEAGERDAPVSILIKLARLGNISLDRLLTTQISEADLRIPDGETAPATPKQLDIIGGSVDEGRLMFKGIKEDFLVSNNKVEKKLLTLFRKLGPDTRENFLLDVEWVFNNTKRFERRLGQKIVAKKVQKAKNAAKLKKMAKTFKKITVKG